jgi:hypothetical protein
VTSFLKELVEYTGRLSDEERKELPQIGYAISGPGIKWEIQIRENGELYNTNLVQIDMKDTMIPANGRTAAIKPLPLVDKLQYVLGLNSNSSKNLYIDPNSKHKKAFIEMLRDVRSGVRDPDLIRRIDAVNRFYEKATPANMESLCNVHGQITPGDNVCFTVIDERGRATSVTDMHMHPEVIHFYSGIIWEGKSLKLDTLATCSVCGDSTDQFAIIMTTDIKNLPGGETGSIVSVNKGAGNSWEAERALNSPMCKQCTLSHANILNKLLTDKRCHYRFNNIKKVLVWWPKVSLSQENSLFAEAVGLGFDATPETIKTAFWSLYKRNTLSVDSIDADGFFFAMIDAGTKARISINSFNYMSLPDMLVHLDTWNKLQDEEPLTMRTICMAVLGYPNNDSIKKNSERLQIALINAILLARPLPRIWLKALLRAFMTPQSAEDKKNHYARMSSRDVQVLKILLHYTNQGKEIMDTEQKTLTAYGRLLNLLDYQQRKALSSTSEYRGKSLSDKYLRRVAIDPAGTLGMLLKEQRHHNKKLLKGETTGSAIWFSKEIQHCAENIDLELLKQIGKLNDSQISALMLGYYQNTQNKLEDNNE